MKWIPVSDRLPESDYMCLVSCKTKKGVKSVNRAYYSDGLWHGSGSMSGVEAWMPLPEPYTADTPQMDAEIPKNGLRSDCTGCRFVGAYDTEFPCANCVRKNKDYYSAEQTERSSE